MTDGLRSPELCVPTVSRQPALTLRPWRAADIPALVAEMSRDYLLGGMWSRPDERPFRTVLHGGVERTGPMGERDAARWLASQDRGWRDGDRLCFAVLAADDAGGCALAGNVGLKNREEPGRIGERETAEIGYWTAEAARGRGVAPAAVRAVTDWVFAEFAGTSLRQIMLVHDVDNPASCRVAEKAGYSSGSSARRIRRTGSPTGTFTCGSAADPGHAEGSQKVPGTVSIDASAFVE